MLAQYGLQVLPVSHFQAPIDQSGREAVCISFDCSVRRSERKFLEIQTQFRRMGQSHGNLWRGELIPELRVHGWK
jgi:hypothetical protein